MSDFVMPIIDIVVFLDSSDIVTSSSFYFDDIIDDEDIHFGDFW